MKEYYATTMGTHILYMIFTVTGTNVQNPSGKTEGIDHLPSNGTRIF